MIPEDFPKKLSKFYDLPDSFYKTLINSLDNGVYLVDRERRVVYWNQSAARISGYTSEEIMGHFCGAGFLQHVDFEGRLLCGFGCPLKETMEDGQQRTTEIFLKHKDGHRIPVRVHANPVYDRSGELIGAVESFYDITPDIEARQHIQQLAEEASTDSLTGLKNRRFADQVLETAYEKWTQYGMSFAVLFVDVDGLKEINDNLGHNAGDVAIKVIARTLRALFRSEDVVARWGGDEFIILMQNINESVLENIIKKVMVGAGAAELPPEYGSKSLSISVGGTLAQDGDTLEAMIKRSDDLMYQSKKQKKN